ncbi:MAG: ribosomal RNA small subunit methyltransferase A [Bacteroidia bacterium]|nr:ribosomal RNA small subunit methyltransferase A [Bacteroidia bacterium]
MDIYPKKRYGQHFLTDKNIADKIVKSIEPMFAINLVECVRECTRLKTSTNREPQGTHNVLEIGPGKGILTDYLINRKDIELHAIEIDTEAIEYLHEKYPNLINRLIKGDFLKFDLKKYFPDGVTIIGNFPYNISSQIFFKTLDNRDIVPVLVSMVQKEVAERIASLPGSKKYGILSVLLQAYYRVEYLFTVNKTVFQPQPDVKSAVIRLTRHTITRTDCNEKLFFQVVKTAFNQRRKILSNSLKSLIGRGKIENEILKKRPEQLSVSQFIELTNIIEKYL